MMCTIFGWNKKIGEHASIVVNQASERGRDGWGFWADGLEVRGIGYVQKPAMDLLMNAEMVVGNFRATPTTEIETRVDLLQPYGGVVHNGTIANDKDFSFEKIDSMVLPEILKGAGTPDELVDRVQQIQGSYALAYFVKNRLMLACNYKPIYYQVMKSDAFVFASQPYMLPHPRRAIQMNPYSVMAVDPNLAQFREIPRTQRRKVVIACSAGLDSTTAAYFARNRGYDVTLAHFRYGSLAEKRELERIKMIAAHGKFDLVILDLPKGILKGTIVEGKFNQRKEGVSGAEYAHDWVSARNLLMLSILTAWAESNRYGYIGFGGNLEESGAYPDNEEEFANKFNALLPYATQNGVKIEVYHPLSRMMKHEIVSLGLQLDVPYELTWSCYSNEKKPCGKCGPCFMREKAFERNGRKDPLTLRR